MFTDHTATALKSRRSPIVGLILALLLGVAAYWPGLYGSYLFDDYPNIVENKDLQIEHISVQNLVQAALASPSSELKRPLASLSFAANFLMTGLDPFWMKFTNLLIHLLNGVLVYVLAAALLRSSNTSNRQGDPRWIALAIAAGWLLLPINLTSVLYVVQRMESLANLFVLLGLWGYVRARQQMQESGTGFLLASGSLLIGTALGLLSKETAVMTPLYALLIEWAVFHAKSQDQPRDRRILGLFLVIFVVPLIAGLVWQLPKILSAGAWATRNFDLAQRLMTETRVIVDYIQWIILPTPQALSFYHDNYPISTGWATPPSTLFCTLLLLALVITTVCMRKRAPLFSLGVALFLGAQLLTATILPLELVFEHRNYFASFGLLLALVPILASGAQSALPIARYALLACLLGLWTVITASNALAWGSPLVLAQTLAQRAPDSPRAQYGLGYTYIVVSKYDPQSPFTEAAYQPLEKAMSLPDASILPEQALIMMNARMHKPIKDEWWDSLITKLRARKTTVQDEGSLDALTKCVEKKDCTLDSSRMVQAFLTALAHPHPSARLLSVYGSYAWNVMGDYQLGRSMLEEAVRSSPREAPYRIALTKMYIAQHDSEGVRTQIAVLQAMNVGGRLNNTLQELSRLQAQP